MAGPRSNLAAFLKALGRLEVSTAFLSQHRHGAPCGANVCVNATQSVVDAGAGLLAVQATMT